MAAYKTVFVLKDSLYQIVCYTGIERTVRSACHDVDIIFIHRISDSLLQGNDMNYIVGEIFGKDKN